MENLKYKDQKNRDQKQKGQKNKDQKNKGQKNKDQKNKDHKNKAQKNLEQKNIEKKKEMKIPEEVCVTGVGEEMSTRKISFWNVAKKICLGGTIVFLLFAIISTTLLLANRNLRESLSNIVWIGTQQIQEIEVYEISDEEENVELPQRVKPLKILRTVAESETPRNHEAIEFDVGMASIPVKEFRKNDKEMLPKRFTTNCETCEQDSISDNYIITPDTEKCDTATLVVTIKSTADHFEHRKSIRESWASLDRNSTVIVFLLGKPDDTDMAIGTEQAITDESLVHSDILMGDYIDSYSNLTKKALSGLRWRNEKCSKPEFFLSVDDDTYVDIDHLLKLHLQKLPHETTFIECSERTVVNGKVWRHGRWAVSKATYDQERYPKYCNGPCYLMPNNAARILYETSRNTVSDLQADDALLTGVFRAKAEIPLIQYTRTKPPGWCVELNNRKPNLPRRMEKEFKKLQNTYN